MIVKYDIGERRTKQESVSLELIGPDGRRRGVCYLSVDAPDEAIRLIQANCVVLEGGPQ